MELTEKELSKLKQLDRIEFRQKFERIEKEKVDFGVIDFVNSMIYICFLIAILATILLVGKMSEPATSLFNLIPLVFKVTIGVAILATIFQLIENYKNNKMKDELKEEYFELKAK